MMEYDSKFWDDLLEDNSIMYWVNDTTCIAVTVNNVVAEVRE